MAKDVKISLRKKFFEEDENENFVFDVEKSTKYILKKFDIIYTPRQGYFLFNNRYWEYAEEDYIGMYINIEMDLISKPFYTDQILKQIKRNRYIDFTEINQCRNRIVLNNGTLDISDWKKPLFYEDKYFRDDFCTIHLDYNYNQEAKYPEFSKYLSSTFEGQPDNIKTVQEMFGYCLTTSTKHEKIFFFYGEGGSGKSVLIDTLKTLVTSSNYSSIPMSLLDKSFLRAGLKDKILNFSTEEGSKLVKDTVTAWIKAISSGDPIEAQFKNKDTFNFNPFCKLVFAMNELPQIENFDEALKRRFIIIEFNKKFRGDEIDLELKEGKLHKEMDGILQFALEGLKRLAEQRDFTYSEGSKLRLEEYRLDSNHAERFADMFLTQGDINSFIKIKDIYQKYIDFCKQNNDKAFKNSEFCRIIKRKFNIPEGRVQKRIKDTSGNQIVEDVFAGITYKTYSNSVDENTVHSNIIDIMEKMKEDKSKKSGVFKKQFKSKDVGDISDILHEV